MEGVRQYGRPTMPWETPMMRLSDGTGWHEWGGGYAVAGGGLRGDLLICGHFI